MLCKCKFRKNGCCVLIASATGLEVNQATVAEDACNACCRTVSPQSGEINPVIASIGITRTKEHAPERYDDVHRFLTPYISPSMSQGMPRKVELAKRYAAAVKRWHNAGRPIRSDEEVQRIFAICMGCKYYKPTRNGSGRCLACGCKLRKNPRFIGLLDALENKIRMATEHCWANKW